MNILYMCSDNFSEICGVSMYSLCKNNISSNEILFYVIDNGISDLNKNRLKDIVIKFNRNIHFIKMPKQKEIFPEIEFNLGRTFCRLIIGKLLPQNVDRVLNLDCDTLILDDISDMYNTIFANDKFVGGVYDCVGRAIQKKVLNAPDDMIYCNAGLFLIDLNIWRKLDIDNALKNELLNSYKLKKPLYFLEQDLMNIVLYDKIQLLEARYNVLTSIYLFDYNEIIKMKKPVEYYSKEEIIKAKQYPAICHATTCFYVKRRMWVKNSDHPYHKWYMEYRNETLWKNEQLMEENKKIKKRLYSLIWHLMPRFFAITFASFVINYLRPKKAKKSGKKGSAVATQSAA